MHWHTLLSWSTQHWTIIIHLVLCLNCGEHFLVSENTLIIGWHFHDLIHHSWQLTLSSWSQSPEPPCTCVIDSSTTWPGGKAQTAQVGRAASKFNLAVHHDY